MNKIKKMFKSVEKLDLNERFPSISSAIFPQQAFLKVLEIVKRKRPEIFAFWGFFYFCTKMALFVPAAAACGFVWSFWSLLDCQKKAETAIQQLEDHLRQCPHCESQIEKEIRRELNPEDEGTIEQTCGAITRTDGLPQDALTVQIGSLPQDPRTIYISGPQVPQPIHAEATGRITKNPFFNYLREFRSTMKGQRQTMIAIEGARHWNRLTLDQKHKYRKLNVVQCN